jgi:hypothetical protein
MPAKPKKSLYSPHPSLAMEQGYDKRLLERTGKTMEQWAEILRKEGPASMKERRDWLKTRHGFTTNYAWFVAEMAEGNRVFDYDPEALVQELFSGGKAGLRPLYDALLKIGLALGSDVKACPCKTFVPLYREHVFAQIKPTTRTRIDLGLALQDTPFSDRLLDTGGRAKKDRITHRIGLSNVDEIDKEVQCWLRSAYDLDGEAKMPAKKPAAQIVVPGDLTVALAASPQAKAAFEVLPPSHRREHVTAILKAKKPETRERRIARVVEMLLQGKKR